MPGKAAIVLGNSHLSSVILYLEPRLAESVAQEDSIQYYIFNTIKHGVDFIWSIDAGGGNYVLNPFVEELATSRAPSDRERIYVSMFGGNAHNALTLKAHPQPFDFIVPWRADLPFDESLEFVTLSYINSFIIKLAQPYLLHMTTLKNFSGGAEVFHFESPPPVKDNAFIMSHLEDWFKGDPDFTVAAPYLRLKMWLAHSRIIKETCDNIGITFLPTPPYTQDNEGFLLPEFGRDSTHAGGAFGAAITKNLEDLLGVKYDGWDWL